MDGTMKNLLILSLALLSLTASAQFATTSTPDPATSFEYKLTSDKSVLMALNAYTLHEVYLDLPFGFDFNAGHSVWLGSRSSIDALDQAQAVIGYEWYALKRIGGDGFFVKGSVGFCVGPRTDDHKALTGYGALSAGWAF